MPMSLSDALQSSPERRALVRGRLEELVAHLSARGGFLVDESGAPFASVGHLEFTLPHPIASLEDGEVVLEALLGEPISGTSKILVERLGTRALLAVVWDDALSERARGRAQRRIRSAALELDAIL